MNESTNIHAVNSYELSSQEKTWRNFKIIFLRERSHSEKSTYCMIPTTLHSRKGKTMGTEIRSIVSRVSGEEGMTRQSMEDFPGRKWSSMIMLRWLHVIIHLPNPQNMTQRANPDINCGLSTSPLGAGKQQSVDRVTVRPALSPLCSRGLPVETPQDEKKAKNHHRRQQVSCLVLLAFLILSPSFPLLHLSKCGLCTSSFSTTRALVRNARSQAPAQTRWICSSGAGARQPMFQQANSSSFLFKRGFMCDAFRLAGQAMAREGSFQLLLSSPIAILIPSCPHVFIDLENKIKDAWMTIELANHNISNRLLVLWY